MNGAGHRATAAAVAAVSLHLAPLPAAGAVAVFTIAVATSSGVASPDIDNYRGFQRLDAALPDEVLGDGGPLKHRGITHFPGVPAALWWAANTIPTIAAGLGPWTVRGIVTGWLAHTLAGDLWFGKGGVPFFGWTLRWGLELDQDGILARVVSWASIAVAAYALATLASPLAGYWPPVL